MPELSKEQFTIIVDNLNLRKDIDRDYLFELTSYALNGADKLNKSNALGRVVPVNPMSIILYLVNELVFFMDVSHKEIKDIKDDDKVMEMLISISLDKYFTNEHLNYKNETNISRFAPPISTLSLYSNFVLGVLSRYKQHIPNETLITDFLKKGFQMIKAIIELMVEGFETEAFSTWRTLHETECILSLLVKNGEPTIKAYLRHLDYAMAYRGINLSKEQIDAIFVEIKDKMHALGLKSKDTKKFIEYGWLTSISGATEVEGFKYNFRDGVERLSGLSKYSSNYEMASEIAHSSPLLIYSRTEYFLHLVLLNVFESFFRIEQIFTKIYLHNVAKEEANRYLVMRKVYYANLEAIYKKEQIIFATLNKK